MHSAFGLRHFVPIQQLLALTRKESSVFSLGVVAPKAAIAARATCDTQLLHCMVAITKEVLVSAQDLAELSGVPYNTIDYWTERKLLSCERVGRTRWYDRTRNLRRVKTIRQLQGEGYSIEAILVEIRRRKL